MKKNLGYIVLAVSGFIYIFYNFTVTSVVIYLLPDLTLSFLETIVAEVSAFIPIALLFTGMQKLSQKREDLFDQFSVKNFFIHSLFLVLFIGIHSSWQVFSNSMLLPEAAFNLDEVFLDVVAFLNMRVMVYLIIIGLIAGVKRIEEKENYKLKESELRLKLERAKVRKIELRLSPDILYPTLGYIKDHLQERPDEASRLLINLSKQMRILIDNLEEETIPIKEDIRFFNYYFEGVEIRLRRELSIVADVDKELWNIRIPSLVLLAPFFENLFFGSYKKYTKEVDTIVYRSHRARKGYIKLSIQLDSIDQGRHISRVIQDDENYRNLTKILQHYEGSSLEPIAEGDKLYLFLDFKYRPEQEEVYA
ncbi:MAG: histidine kinase [Balneolaceae bacterium]|nr:histidine kinase [Balneolaceae bacterium]